MPAAPPPPRCPTGPEPPKERKPRERLDQRVRPESHESDRAGHDPRAESDRRFNPVPPDPKPRQELRSPDEGLALIRVVNVERDRRGFHHRGTVASTNGRRAQRLTFSSEIAYSDSPAASSAFGPMFVLIYAQNLAVAQRVDLREAGFNFDPARSTTAVESNRH